MSAERTPFQAGCQATIGVMVVGEVRLFRDGLEHALNTDGRFEVLGTADSPAAALEGVLRLRPEIVLVDLVMRDSLATVSVIVEASPDTAVIALAVRDVESDIIACAEAGAVGYVTREGSLADLMASIEAARHGELCCTPRIAGSLMRRVSSLAAERPGPTLTTSLSAREQDVLRLIDRGLSNKQIARALGIELATVKNHVHRILEKLQVSRRGEAAARMRTLRSGASLLAHGAADAHLRSAQQ